MLPSVSDQYFDIYLMDDKQFAWNIDMHVEDFNMDLDLIRNWKEMINHNFSSCLDLKNTIRCWLVWAKDSRGLFYWLQRLVKQV